MAAKVEAVAAALPVPTDTSQEPFTETQWVTLLAIMDTIIQSVQRDTSDKQTGAHMEVTEKDYQSLVESLKETTVEKFGNDVYESYLGEKATGNVQFEQSLKRVFGQLVPEASRKGLAVVLSALNTRVGSLLLTGYTVPIHDQPMPIRETILLGWRDSYLPTLNLVYKQMTILGKNFWLKTSPGYRSLIGMLKALEHKVEGEVFKYDFLQFSSGDVPEIIETDVVIVGSGCGGGVSAKNLAEAGNKVLVVEKGYHFTPDQLPMSEDAGLFQLFESGAAITSDEGAINVVAGTSWGGGGTINWSASLQPQHFVRKEWSQQRGLKFFESAEFQSCLDLVCDRMGVSADHIRHNHANRNILEGSRRLGYHAMAVPQNTGGKEHYCGHCTLGCASNEKQGPAVSWLPDAVRAGAKMVEGFKVDRVIFDETDSSKAIGVKGTWTSKNSKGGVDGPVTDCVVREVIVKAKKVVLSSGTLWSPLILMNSGLKNWQIGRNLYLHPASMVAAVYKDDVKPWEGGILTSVCSSFENLDGQGHGAKLEPTVMLPSMFLVGMPWTSGISFKANALKIRRMNGFISLGRDRDPGRVYPDPTSGKPRVTYTPSAFDRANIMEGLIGLCKICYVSGATEIRPFIQGLRPFIRCQAVSATSESDDLDPGVTDPLFGEWLEEFKRIGNKPPYASFTSAHQMGTCRMSTHERDGVVDEKGRVWGTQNLYVSDASVFPSASGVNPMITNMAISDWISRGIAREMKGVSVEA
ncbi:putative long-chain-alcohol oxidase FAO2 [Amylocarpus encephaloides]|uniref:Long-chain-alcohol oxidase n=1 Tax=Amylocarpus encephaloides TaxID=45428 RepID=A0A9P7YGT6_9HELO|nr:putative long-chain-alcohol oxidase FAO2 [Amylocarpus encephaloides]